MNRDVDVNRDVDRDKDKKSTRFPGSAQDSEEAVPSVGPHNPALGEIYQRLYPEMRRPKPNQEAIAAALQAMQRLTMKADSETVAEETAHGSRLCRLTMPAASADITIATAISFAAFAEFRSEPSRRSRGLSISDPCAYEP